MDKGGQALAWREGGAMAGRCATALLGGYAAAAGLAALLARTLPVARVEATAWGLILSFLVYAALGLWVFHARRLLVAAGAVWGLALVSAGLVLALGVRP